MYRVDKGLSIFTMKAAHRLEPVLAEDGFDQSDALFCIEGMADQMFPGRRVAGYGEAVKPTNARSLKITKSAHALRKILNTSEACGRDRRFPFQQRCIKSHNSGVNVGRDGRGGRLFWLMSTIASAGS